MGNRRRPSWTYPSNVLTATLGAAFDPPFMVAALPLRRAILRVISSRRAASSIVGAGGGGGGSGCGFGFENGFMTRHYGGARKSSGV